MITTFEPIVLGRLSRAEFDARAQQAQANLAIDGYYISDEECAYIYELAKRAKDDDHLTELIIEWCMKEFPEAFPPVSDP